MIELYIVEVNMMGSNLVQFLTSDEILIVYLIAGIACLICFIIYQNVNIVNSFTVKK